MRAINHETVRLLQWLNRLRTGMYLLMVGVLRYRMASITLLQSTNDHLWEVRPRFRVLTIRYLVQLCDHLL